MAFQKVVCWNSAGIRASATSTPSKIAFFDNEYPNGNFAIAAFTETHHKGIDDLPEKFREYSVTHHLIHSPTSTSETHGGVLALISKQYNITNYREVIPGRLLNIKFTYGNTETQNNLSIFYGPRWNKMKKEDMIRVIDYFDQVHDINENNMILGDFNFVENDIDKGKNMDGRDKMIYPLWQNFRSKNAIIDPYRSQYPRRKVWSYVAPAGKSRGDRVYISEDYEKTIANMRYTNTPFNSAHKIMSFELQHQSDIGPGYWKLNSSILKDELYRTQVEELHRDIQELHITNPLDRWDLFLMAVRGVTKKYTREKSRVKKELKNYVVSKIQTLENIPEIELTIAQKEDFSSYKNKYKEIVNKEIQGHEIRTKGYPRYELNEPDIDFYSKLEKRSQSKNVITQLQDEHGKMKTQKDDLLDITKTFYKKLYTPSKTNLLKQQQLLKNIDRTIDHTDRQKLDAPMNQEELLISVEQLHDNRSPGQDGFTAEFYKTFWYLIKDDYLEYINRAKESSFSEYRNTSVTTIIYKLKGETYDLSNYRPIALINVDIKILTKTLTNRLKPILPKIIHHSQTAVQGRRIDHTIHMLRDLIDLVEKEDTEAAFIFLDQEKAFDRVDHRFLFKTMKAFGIGDGFIQWVKVIYSNATTKIKINGHLTENIPLLRGLRQGCPLSAPLYVLVIEILALQLRKNPNIVGFKVGGEKIVSNHYADDSIISITQNKCFKEVIKDLGTYEEAAGAKVNYLKTKGLWLGKWKNREDKPLGIEWTNKNVKTLGVYFGNDNPDVRTFDDIIIKIKRSLNYWKQFSLSIFAKARVTEIFHASRLWYAANFYNIPLPLIKTLQKAFLEYIIFPHTTVTVCENEMQKIRLHGGIKLIDIKSKEEASRIRWLIELVTNSELKVHLNIVNRLIGTQKGGLQGTDTFFTTKKYADRILVTPTQYYKEAIKAITKLQVKKRITDPKIEKLFFNPTFKTSRQSTLTPNLTCSKNGITTYGQVLDEHEKRLNNQPHNRHIANVYRHIAHKDLEDRKDNVIYHSETQKYITFDKATHKMVYQELIRLNYKEHHSKSKWEERFGNLEIDWKMIWKTLNNPLTTEDAKSIIWEQVHLNDYTTYSYNKWHNAQQKCPFCSKVPQNRFHITIECPTLHTLWMELEKHLTKIHPTPLTDTEKAFGIIGDTKNITLRNWLTFILRQCIVEQENTAFHNQKFQENIIDIKIIYNQKIKSEVWKKYNIYSNLGRLAYFEQSFAVNNHLINWENEQWNILTLFKTHYKRLPAM